MIRYVRVTDVPGIVKIHLESFPGFFLTFLGSTFLRELYIAILCDPTGIGFIAEDEKAIQGFVTGTHQPSGFYHRLLHQRWWRFGLASVLPVLRNPKIIPRLLGAFSRREQIDIHENCALLMSIAVDPEFQGQGIGKLLIDAFLNEAKNRGVSQVNLTTDKVDNDAVNAFYKRVGFWLNSSFITPEGREMNEYIIDL
jgi:ribosomal protein S18 acetylase RimI-like enzyme